MSKSKPMTKIAASRIQSSAALKSKKGGISKDSFAARAQSAADKNSKK